MPATVYKAHPLCAAFPKMSDVEFGELRFDIKANGLRVPIVLFEGMVLDGGHRYSACLDVGVEPRFVQFTGDDPATFVLSMNYKRRSMNASQRALVVAELAPRLEAEAAKRKAAAGASNLAKATAPPSGYAGIPTKAAASPTVAEALEAVGEAAGIVPPVPSPKSKPGRTRERVAEAAQVGESTAQAAIDVVKHGDEATKQAVRSGEVTVKEAARTVRERRAEAADAPKPLKCSLGVAIDEARAPSVRAYLDLHHKATVLHRQLVEVTSDLLALPLAPLFAVPSAYETMSAGGKDRQRHKTLERFREMLNLSRNVTTCPTCVGKGCKGCKHLGLLGGEDLGNFPADRVAEAKARAKQGAPLEPLGQEGRALWEAKYGPLPAAAPTTDEEIPF